MRYLRARQWNLHKAGKMLKDTLAWRAEYKPEEITWEEIKSEAELKKVTILDDFDKDGRPVVFMRPRNEVRGSPNDLKLKYVVYVMERASTWYVLYIFDVDVNCTDPTLDECSV